MPAGSAPGSAMPSCRSCGRGSIGSHEPQRPVVALPKGAVVKGVHWTEPALVAEVRFAGWTADAVLRHATFLGLREDKAAKEVVRDMPSSTHRARTTRACGAVPPRRAPASIARDGSTDFEGVRLTHADRVLYPDEGITKLDLARYYAEIADWALPHLGHRPLSLVRCPDRVRAASSFFRSMPAPACPRR